MKAAITEGLIMKYIALLTTLCIFASCVSKEYTREENAARKLLRLLSRYKMESGLCQRARRKNHSMINQLIPDGTRREDRLLRLSWRPIVRTLNKHKRKAHCLTRRNMAELFHMLGLAHEFNARGTVIINRRKCISRKTATHMSFAMRAFCKVHPGNMLSAAQNMKEALRYYTIASYLRKGTDVRVFAETEAITQVHSWIERFKASVQCVKNKRFPCYRRRDASNPLEKSFH